MFLIALVLQVAAPAACPGTTTIEVNACLSSGLAADQAGLDRYLAAARGRVAAEHPATVPLFDRAQAAWLAYRDKSCGAAGDFWAGGTIRVARELQCRQRLTRARIHDVWREWLTYPDSTPPLLPEPVLGD